LQGRFFWNKRTEEGYKKAIEFFDEALQRDPNFALAYSGLADCYMLRSEQLAPAETMPKSKAAAEKAIALDDSLAEAYTSLARVKQYYDWDWTGAEEAFKKALERNPNYAMAHHWYGQFLQDIGRPAEARQEMNRARELEPLSLVINTDWGSFLRDAGEHDQAFVVYRKVIEMDGSFAKAHLELGRALTEKKLYQEAIAEIQKAITVSEASPRLLGALGYVYAVSSQRAKAQEILARLQKMPKEVY